jgi:hypothetical protein
VWFGYISRHWKVPFRENASLTLLCGAYPRCDFGNPQYGAADCGEYREAAGAIAPGLIGVLSATDNCDADFVWSPAMEKHELSKIDFEIIEKAFSALLQSHPDPVTADKIADLRDMFRDAYTGWLEIEEAA